MQQPPQATVAAVATAPSPDSGEFPAEAPPKQVALAMDRLSHAGRLIADIRLGADRLLEAIFVAADRLPHQSEKPIHLIIKEEESMRKHLEDLRTVGKSLFPLSISIFLGLGFLYSQSSVFKIKFRLFSFFHFF